MSVLNKVKSLQRVAALIVLLTLAACDGTAGGRNDVENSMASALSQISPASVLATSPVATSGSFKHPGVLVTRDRLDAVKAQIAANNPVVAHAFDAMKNSVWAAKTYAVQGPPADGRISCDTASTNDHGCKAELRDATAAYTQSLMWYLTGDQTYADNAIAIMNAYSSKLTGGHGGTNGPLQSAWAAEIWPAAAEIIRYTASGWSPDDAKAFATMLTTQYLPSITGENGAGKNGNWKLSMIDGMFGIAVFTDDRSLFDSAVALWKRWVPAYYYNADLDGNAPVTFPGGPGSSHAGGFSWNGQTVFNSAVSGVTQETCRDTQHVGLAIAATFNAAETAYIQGTDLYTVEQQRLTTALEFLSTLLRGVRNTSQIAYTDVPADLLGSLCSGSSAPNTDKFVPVLKGTMVRAYNAYAIRNKVDLPETNAHVMDDIIPFAIPDDGHNVQWEVLTHGGWGATNAQ
ncbi:alginate lyase family protein [Paraburkholderia xenovorans]|uniref:alginate lyase family protein n=1 Tax=Paraburkholderia xenovorans TaxID=36873 RepID=UPI0038BCBDC2